MPKILRLTARNIGVGLSAHCRTIGTKHLICISLDIPLLYSQNHKYIGLLFIILMRRRLLRLSSRYRLLQLNNRMSIFPTLISQLGRLQC